MDSRISQTPFPLLELPGELRDMVYKHVLFASALTTDISQRRENLEKGAQIHIKILLTSHQVFEEARNVIIDAQLVQVITRGGKPQDLRTAAAIEDGIPLFHSRYRKFCLLKHRIDEDVLSESWDRNEDVSCVIRKEDVYRFCGGISGLDPDRYVPQILSPRITHDLELVNPEARLPPGPSHVSIRVPTHQHLLREYQSVLGGCRHIWIAAHWSVEMDMGFMDDMVKKIMLSNTARISSLSGRVLPA